MNPPTPPKFPGSGTGSRLLSVPSTLQFPGGPGHGDPTGMRLFSSLEFHRSIALSAGWVRPCGAVSSPRCVGSMQQFSDKSSDKTLMETRTRRFLMTLWDGGGNAPPELVVAKRLVARGHQVHVLGDPTLAGAAEAMGC